MAERQNRGQQNNPLSIVTQRIENLENTLVEAIEKYSGELVMCMVCDGRGVKSNAVTGEPLLSATLEVVPCSNCSGTGKRRV